MPEMLSGKELYERLADIPSYDETIREKSQTERLMALSTFYDIYLPSEMLSRDLFKTVFGVGEITAEKRYTGSSATVLPEP